MNGVLTARSCATDELELFEIVGPLHERLLDDGSLGVVLVVEGADGAAGLEALRVPDRVSYISLRRCSPS